MYDINHRRWRLGRLGPGPQALRQERQQGPALRGRTGHAARQRAARNSRQLFGHGLFRSALPLDRAQGHDPGRQPQQPGSGTPAAAQIRAGARVGRRVLDQRPDGQPRRADRLRRMGGAGRRGLELEGRAALFQEGRARPRFRRAVPRQGWPHPGPAHPAGALDPARAGRCRGLQARRLRLRARPERRVRRRLFSGDALQSVRATRLGGDGLSRSRDAQARQPDDLDRHAGQGTVVRGHALRRRQGAGRRPGTGIPRPRGRALVRRDPFAGASAARRHRPGRAPQGDGHSGSDGP